MALIDRVTAIFRRGPSTGSGRSSAQDDRAARRTTSDELAASRGPSPLDLAGDLRAMSDRRAKIKACREMYEEDPRGEDVLSTLARDMVRGGFEVEIGAAAPAAQAQEALAVAQALQKRLNLEQRLDDWVRLSLRDGDSFLELGVDANLDIAVVTRKPTLEMRRNSNSYDGFDDPRRAFWQGEEWLTEAARDVVWFAQWQIIHARWHHDEGSRYGRPLLASATRPYKRIAEGETDLAVRRKTRAGLKYVHKFPEGTDRTVIDEYKLINRDSLSNPLAAIADYFGTVDVHTVQGDAQLGQIDDVMHHIRTWFLASPVPMSLLGYGQDLNRDVLEAQQEQYLRSLEGLESWPETEIVRPLLERQWLLKGIVPEGLGYQIKWRSKQPLTAGSVEKAANAALKLRAVGVPDEVVRAVLEALLPGVDFSQWTGGSGQGPVVRGQGAGENRASAGRMAQTAEALWPAR